LAQPVSLLHTSDCHLGSDSRGREERAFESAVDFAIARSVDLFVIAGDLFDDTRLPDGLLSWALAQLARLECPVTLMPGNHDAHEQGAVYSDFMSESRGTNIHTLADESGSYVDLDQDGISVWGKALVQHTPEFRPLGGMPKRRNGNWHIALGHGYVQNTNLSNGRSSPILPDELEQADCDYIALGHCHVFRDVTSGGGPPAFYSGATASSREGRAGVILVELAEGHPTDVSWRELPSNG
jgi:DNA repair exonuclease SbcCD nuclease subunit